MRSLALPCLALIVPSLVLGCADPSEIDSVGEPGECAPVTVPVEDGAGAQELGRVATRDQIPGLADQPTAHGQVLSDLAAFDGRLHLGYGDYDQNTGPITAPVWDPVALEFLIYGVLPTEEARGMFLANGALFMPAIDPDGHQEDGGIYRLDCALARWAIETPIAGAVHVYDLSVQGDTIYAGTGSLGDAPALVMATADGGRSWTEVLRHESPPGGFSRFLYSGATPDLLFVAGREFGTGDAYFAFARRGAGDFEPLAAPPTGALAAVVLGDALRIVEFSSAPGFGSYRETYRVGADALEVDPPWPELDAGSELVAWTHQGAEAHGRERLLALMADASGGLSVHASEDLDAGPEGFVELARLEAGALDGELVASMALLGNDLYFGTRAGSLWTLRELELPASE